MAFTRVYSSSTPVGSTTAAKDMDNSLRYKVEDVGERLVQIVGAGAVITDDPLVDGTTAKSLEVLTAELATVPTYASPAANAVPRVSVASPLAFVSGSLTDDGTTVALKTAKILDLQAQARLYLYGETAGASAIDIAAAATHTVSWANVKDEIGSWWDVGAPTFITPPAAACLLSIYIKSRINGKTGVLPTSGTVSIQFFSETDSILVAEQTYPWDLVASTTPRTLTFSFIFPVGLSASMWGLTNYTVRIINNTNGTIQLPVNGNQKTDPLQFHAFRLA